MKLPFERPKGPLAALFVGMMYADDSSGENKLMMLTYRPKLIDVGKLDMISPPWLRSRSQSDLSSRHGQGLLESFCGHHAKSAIDRLSLGSHGQAMCKILIHEDYPEILGIAVALRRDGALDGVIASNRAIGREDESKAWGRLFLAECGKSLGGRRQGFAEWQEAPSGLERAAAHVALGLGASGIRDDLAAWAPALKAIQELAELSKLKAGADKAGKKWGRAQERGRL